MLLVHLAYIDVKWLSLDSLQRPVLGSFAMSEHTLLYELQCRLRSCSLLFEDSCSARAYTSYRLRLYALAAQMEYSVIRTVCCLLEHTAYFYRGINSFLELRSK